MLEPNHIYHADCMELMREIPDGSIDMVLTDIPYNEVNRDSNGLRNLDKGLADSSGFNFSILLSELTRVCSGSIYMFCGIEQVSYIKGVFCDSGLTARLCIWEKTNPSPMNGQYVWLSSIECCIYGKKPGAVFNEFCASPVWRHPVVRDQIHPTEKPYKLFMDLIMASTNPGDLVFDPFAGVCTTAMAAAKTNRDFICIEIDKKYCDIGKKRVGAEMNQLKFDF